MPAGAGGVHADVFSQAWPPSRPRAGSVSGAHAGSGHAAFTAGLNQILLVAAIIALVSGVISVTAIRSRDFVGQRGSLRDDPGT